MIRPWPPGKGMYFHWLGRRRLPQVDGFRGWVLVEQLSQPQHIHVVVVVKVAPPAVVETYENTQCGKIPKLGPTYLLTSGAKRGMN